MSKFSWTRSALTGAFCYLVSSSAWAVGALPASGGFADDTAQTTCFLTDWDNPGRIHINPSCNTAWQMWDVPVPVYAPGTKTFAFNGSCRSVGGLISPTYDAFVLKANGDIVRWDEVKDCGWDGWRTFAPLVVNVGEAAELALPIFQAANAHDDFFSMVTGF